MWDWKFGEELGIKGQKREGKGPGEKPQGGMRGLQRRK
jgi:hypothetical protein